MCRQRAEACRREEVRRVRKLARLMALFDFLLFVGPVAATIAAFAAYELAGRRLTPAKVGELHSLHA